MSYGKAFFAKLFCASKKATVSRAFAKRAPFLLLLSGTKEVNPLSVVKTDDIQSSMYCFFVLHCLCIFYYICVKMEEEKLLSFLSVFLISLNRVIMSIPLKNVVWKIGSWSFPMKRQP